MTKERYVVKENENQVAWEREVRKFLRGLSLNNGHRVSAVMIFEWATGLNVKEIKAATPGALNGPLRWINHSLQFYYGKPYTTYIAGQKVQRAYRVPANNRILRRRPESIELYLEWRAGTLQA
jgi:hypothetical protein